MAATAALLTGGTATEVTLVALIYAMLQACAVWAVRSEQREAAARERLAVANAELRAATSSPRWCSNWRWPRTAAPLPLSGMWNALAGSPGTCSAIAHSGR